MGGWVGGPEVGWHHGRLAQEMLPWSSTNLEILVFTIKNREHTELNWSYKGK